MSQNGSKTRFSKSDPEPFGMHTQEFLAHFEPVETRYGPWKMPKCLENGPFWDQKWVKNGSETSFPKSDPGPFGILKLVFLAHFEPVLNEFSPFHHMYAPLCALRTYLRAVWWSWELGEGCRLDIYIYIYIYIYLYIYIYIYIYIYSHSHSHNHLSCRLLELPGISHQQMVPALLDPVGPRAA